LKFVLFLDYLFYLFGIVVVISHNCLIVIILCNSLTHKIFHRAYLIIAKHTLILFTNFWWFADLVILVFFRKKSWRQTCFLRKFEFPAKNFDLAILAILNIFWRHFEILKFQGWLDGNFWREIQISMENMLDAMTLSKVKAN
jgi:hypothetical protein